MVAVIRPTRQEIEAITGGNPRTTRAFEILFEQLNTTTAAGDAQAEVVALQEQALVAQSNAISKVAGDVTELANRLADYIERPGGLAPGDQIQWTGSAFVPVEPKEWIERGSVLLSASGTGQAIFATPYSPATTRQVVLTAQATSGMATVVNFVGWVDASGERIGFDVEGSILTAIPSLPADGLVVDWILL